jgi:hypothetical protein
VLSNIAGGNVGPEEGDSKAANQSDRADHYNQDLSSNPLPEAQNTRARLVDGAQLTPPPKGNFELDGHHFHSRSEAACGFLMQKYIEPFVLQEGRTFQVPIGASEQGHIRATDFRYRDTFIEFHPPRMFSSKRNPGDFKNDEERRQYNKIMRSRKFNRKDKKLYKNVMKKRLTAHYTEKRLKQINENPRYQDADLIVATDAAEVYDKIIKRFATEPIPSKEDFIREFHSAQSKTTDTSEKGRRQEAARAKRLQTRANKGKSSTSGEDKASPPEENYRKSA